MPIKELRDEIDWTKVESVRDNYSPALRVGQYPGQITFPLLPNFGNVVEDVLSAYHFNATFFRGEASSTKRLSSSFFETSSVELNN
jgi:hypothetical protein